MKAFILLSLIFPLVSFSAATQTEGFVKGYPTSSTIKEANDSQDFQRAVMAYKFWYPTISNEGIFNGAREQGLKDNEEVAFMMATPSGRAFTPNADTPYASGALDLKNGPIVIEVPAGPFIGLVDDHHQRWIMDLGIPGVNAGKGGKHLILPPDYKGDIPSGYHVGKSSSFKLLFAMRILPENGDQKAAMEKLKAIKIYHYSTAAGNPKLIKFVDLNNKKMDMTSLRWEDNLEYWKQLHKVVEAEPVVEEFQSMYGVLTALGIEKGKPFNPDTRMKSVLERAAKEGLSQMLVSAYGSQRPERMVWKDRKWEWVSLVSDNADFMTKSTLDLDARDRWFAQAIVTSPAMFRRKEGAGSLYWLGLRDKRGQYLDGNKTYKLTVPGPVPAKLFWSVTLYDTQTRSFIETDQMRPALRSLFELKDMKSQASYDLYFGPKAPAGKENQWIKTDPQRAWFAYFRIYGPGKEAFNGSWKPGDFEEVPSGDQTAQR
jgi:hypothetical protein